MRGFDCNVKLSYDLAKKFYSDGYRFAIRYVGREKTYSHDIDRIERDNILKSRLQLGVVQHCPAKPGIFPSKKLGALWGNNAAIFAEQAGYKKGCIIYLDLEDVNIAYQNRQQEIIDFCNAWYDECQGYTPGIYVGFNTFLSSAQLYHKLKFQDYWRSFSSVPDVEKRGYAMFQRLWINVNGIDIDTDEVTGDNLGRRPIFMEAEKSLTRTIEVYSDGSITIKEEV